MGIVFLFVVIIVVFFLFLVKNLPAANRASVPSSPESENSTDVHPVIYTPPDVPKSPSSEEDSSISLPLPEKDKTEPPSSPDSGPVAIAVAAQTSESDSGIGKTCLSTDCSTIQEITSLTSEKGKDSDDDIKDPMKPIKVGTGSEKSPNEDPDSDKSAKSLKVFYTPHSQETVTTIVDQSTSSSVTEGTAV
ncbi:uncharacterized protein LOC129227220 [Uloborus diversus]|uniref:uncharacterized protein LOC129227220 n=1 Tax=Uloborus diversus TaxID=327109 RepID=UPI0024094521|nr:uncharacterized protein LOC129227220 [Uloborus diversus]